MTCSAVSLIARVAGEEYDLNSGSIRLLNYDLGLPAVRRLGQRAPAQQGDTDLGYRMEPRFVDLFWVIQGRGLDDYRNLREMFMTIFRPRDNDAVQLVFDFGDRVRALDVNLDGELNWTDRVADIERVSGVFKASDPRLYHPDIRTVIFSLEGSGGSIQGWEIPWEIPWEIGTDTLNATVNLMYADGNKLAAQEFPIIRIFGPIDNPIITNLTTGEVINLTANGGISLLDPSEWIEIDLANPPRRDAKTIRDQDGNSAEEFMTTDSDFATWHLAPAGERLPAGNYSTGLNAINVTGENVSPNTLITMRYYDRYLGV